MTNHNWQALYYWEKARAEAAEAERDALKESNHGRLVAAWDDLASLRDQLLGRFEQIAELEAELAAALKGWRGESSAVAHEQARRIAAEARVEELAKWAGIRGEAAEAELAVSEKSRAEYIEETIRLRSVLYTAEAERDEARALCSAERGRAAALEAELAEAYGANYMAKYLSQIERAEAAEAEVARLREAIGAGVRAANRGVVTRAVEILRAALGEDTP